MSFRLPQRFRLCDPWLLVAVATGAGLRFSRLGDFHNEYYTATVASMLQNPHNFFFASFDPGGVVMVDKPPVSFWIEAIPAALFGVSSWSVTLTQAIAGTLAIIILYMGIKPTFGRLAAAASALVLAVLPSSVIIDSRNEPDSLLSLLLLLAAACVIRAVQTGKWRWLVAFAVLMGIGFNTKMAVAFLPLPAFLLYYVVVSTHRGRLLAIRFASMLAILVLVSLSWVTIVGLTPSENRPYIGSTPDNSIWTLVIKYNGIDRFTSFGSPRMRSMPPLPPGGLTPPPQMQQPQFPPPSRYARPGPQPFRPPAITPDTPDSGLLGLLGNPQAGQLGWLLPLGLVSLIAILVPLGANKGYYRSPRGVLARLRASPALSESILWGGWFATAVVVFGLADATTTHTYYLVGIAVPLAAVAGAGFSVLWRAFRRGSIASWLLPGILVGTALYQIFAAQDLVVGWAIATMVAALVVATLVMVVAICRGRTVAPLVTACVLIGAASLLIIPLVFATTVGGRIVGPTSALQGSLPPAHVSAQDERLSAIASFIDSQGDAGSEFALGTVNAREAAPFIIAGVPAVAIGGFTGSDPIFRVESFDAMAQRGYLRYFLITPSHRPAGPQRPQRHQAQEEILSYVRQTWEDVSQAASLPPGSLYRYAG